MSVQHCYHYEESGSDGFHSSYKELMLAIYERAGQFRSLLKDGGNGSFSDGNRTEEIKKEHLQSPVSLQLVQSLWAAE